MRILLILLLALLPEAASAACHIKSETAAVCSSGLDAALAFGAFRFDTSKMKQSYNQAILQQHGCFLIDAKTEIRQMSHGRVPFTDGWAGVTTIVVGPSAGAIADQYLEGKCDRYKPETLTLHSDFDEPVFGH